MNLIRDTCICFIFTFYLGITKFIFYSTKYIYFLYYKIHYKEIVLSVMFHNVYSKQ